MRLPVLPRGGLWIRIGLSLSGTSPSSERACAVSCLPHFEVSLSLALLAVGGGEINFEL